MRCFGGVLRGDVVAIGPVDQIAILVNVEEDRLRTVAEEDDEAPAVTASQSL